MIIGAFKPAFLPGWLTSEVTLHIGTKISRELGLISSTPPSRLRLSWFTQSHLMPIHRLLPNFCYFNDLIHFSVPLLLLYQTRRFNEACLDPGQLLWLTVCGCMECSS